MLKWTKIISRRQYILVVVYIFFLFFFIFYTFSFPHSQIISKLFSFFFFFLFFFKYISTHTHVRSLARSFARAHHNTLTHTTVTGCWRTQAYEELEDLLAKNNICIAVKEKLVKDSGVAEEIAYDNIVLKLLTKPRARGKFDISYFCCCDMFHIFFTRFMHWTLYIVHIRCDVATTRIDRVKKSRATNRFFACGHCGHISMFICSIVSFFLRCSLLFFMHTYYMDSELFVFFFPSSKPL